MRNKPTIILFTVLFTLTAFSQKSGKVKPEEVIWNTVVRSLIDKNLEAFDRYVQFTMNPLGIDSLKMTKKDFLANFDQVFTKEIRNALKESGPKEITSNDKITYELKAAYKYRNSKYEQKLHNKGINLVIKKINKQFKLVEYWETRCKCK